MPKYSFLIFIILFLSSCKMNKDQTNEVTIFAASSLQGALDEIIEEYEKKSDLLVKVNFASSGSLARQIENGASVDLYLSADKKWTDYLMEKGIVEKAMVADFLQNRLAFVVPLEDDSINRTYFDASKMMEYVGEGRLAIGDPSHVPSGKYAVEVLEYFGIEAIENKMIKTKDVRSALSLVEMGEAPLGIVYETDARLSEKVSIVGQIPDEAYSPVIYQNVQLSTTAIMNRLSKYLTSEKAKLVWEKYGYQTINRQN